MKWRMLFLQVVGWIILLFLFFPAPQNTISAQEMPPDEPKEAAEYVEQGIKLYSSGLLIPAISQFDRAIEVDSYYAEAYYRRGNAYYALGNLQAAIADFSEAIRINPDYAYAYCNRGGAYSDLGMLQPALADLNRAIELDPTDSLAYYNRGRVFYGLGQPEKASADFSRAIELDPGYKQAYSNRGVVYAESGSHKSAVSDFTYAITLDPQCEQDCRLDYSNRGYSYTMQGDYEAALADYKTALEIDPDFAQAYINRSAAYLELGEHDLAMADANRVLDIDPNLGVGYCLRGFIYAQKAENLQALTELDTCSRLLGQFFPAEARQLMNQLEAGRSITPPGGGSFSLANSLIGILAFAAGIDLFLSYYRRQPSASINASETPRTRGGCLTLLLIFTAISGAATIISYLLTSSTWDQLRYVMPWLEQANWLPVAFGIFGVLMVVSAVGLWLWRKWGLYVLIGSALWYGLITIAAGFPLLWSLAGIVEIDLIWGRLKNRWALYT